MISTSNAAADKLTKLFLIVFSSVDSRVDASGGTYVIHKSNLLNPENAIVIHILSGTIY